MNCKLCHKELKKESNYLTKHDSYYFNCCPYDEWSQYWARFVDNQLNTEDIWIDLQYRIVLDYLNVRCYVYKLKINNHDIRPVQNDLVEYTKLIEIQSVPRFDWDDHASIIRKIKLYTALS